MKTCLILEDSPKGIVAKLIWQPNDYQDHLPDSIAMHLMANFIKSIEDQEKLGVVRLFREGSNLKPSHGAEASPRHP
jgi:hypothetical protein